jgi:hypothetical protein
MPVQRPPQSAAVGWMGVLALLTALAARGDERITVPESQGLRVPGVSHEAGNGLTGRVTLEAGRPDSVPLTRFFWNAWDRFLLADWIEKPQSAKVSPSAEFAHPNSLAVDLDGNYVVSWRAMGRCVFRTCAPGRSLSHDSCEQRGPT